MALRTIKRVKFGRCTMSIQRDAANDEFVVVAKAPNRNWNGRYHTNDKADARATAADSIRRMRRAGAC